MKTLLIALNRSSGEYEILAGHSVPLVEQKARLRKLSGPHNENEKYSEAVVTYISGSGPLMKFPTKKEVDARVKSNKDFAESEAKAKADRQAKSQPGYVAPKEPTPSPVKTLPQHHTTHTHKTTKHY